MNPITTVRLQSLSSTDQMQVPFTFGQVFKAGDLAPTDGLAAGGMPLQVDVKALHADGSVRHAIISGVLPKLKAGDTAVLELVKVPAKQNPVFSLAGLSLPDAKVSLTIGADTYAASLTGANLSSFTPWLSGSVVVEGFAQALLKNAQGSEHPLLRVRFGVRYYLASKKARIEFIVENTKTFTAANRFTYDADCQIAGKTVYKAFGLIHYHHSRWHTTAWAGSEPAVHVIHDTGYLIETQAVPNYDLSTKVGESAITNLLNGLTSDKVGPMKIGPVTSQMGMTGGRGDIGPLPSWAVVYLFTQDKRAKDVMLDAADGSGSWSVHYRDENTGLPLRCDNDKNALVSTHVNRNWTGPLPVPRAVGDDNSLLESPYGDDSSHQPSLVYLPYLVTGEYYYLEELQFWVSYNPLGTDPGNSGYGRGLLRWMQVRGQAWSLRTLGHAAYITPDSDPMKQYFLNQLDENLNFYNQTYVVGNPNKLGAYDGSGEGAFEAQASAPWQDDFLTWSFGHLVELGFTSALPIFQWKAQYPVGRMTAAGYCWIVGAPYTMKFRDTNGKVLETFADLYELNYGSSKVYNDDAAYVDVPPGPRFTELPCASQEQADWMSKIHNYKWSKGQMVGYSGTPLGYPANMQPALSLAVGFGMENAQRGWDLYQSRANKPDFSSDPQWNIIPRSMPQPVAVPYTPPVVLPPVPARLPMLTIGQKPKDGIDGTWAKIGDENGRIKAIAGTFVRYGVPGKAYRYAQVIGEFVATNDAFGGDPVPQVVKVVEVFTVSPQKKPGKIKTGANKKLAKLKGLQVTVIDPVTLTVVKVFDGITASSTGILTLSDEALTIGAVYALKVADAKGSILDIMYPLTATK